MEKEEYVAMSTPVCAIELFDLLSCKPHLRFVLWQRFLVSVDEISQQPEVQVVVTVCQEPDLEGLDQILDVLSAGQHGRYNHQGVEFRRNSLGEIHARQPVRRNHQCRQPVHQGKGKMAEAQNQEDTDQREEPAMNSIGMSMHQQACGKDGGDQHYRAQIENQREPAAHSPKGLGIG